MKASWVTSVRLTKCICVSHLSVCSILVLICVTGIVSVGLVQFQPLFPRANSNKVCSVTCMRLSKTVYESVHELSVVYSCLYRFYKKCPTSCALTCCKFKGCRDWHVHLSNTSNHCYHQSHNHEDHRCLEPACKQTDPNRQYHTEFVFAGLAAGFFTR